MKRTLVYKIAFIGNMKVGKTLIIEHIMNIYQLNNPDFQTYDPTIGLDVKTKYFNIDGAIIKSHIYDTSGNPLFTDLCISYRKQCDILCVVYDITNRESYDAIHDWITLRPINATTRTLLIGNKIDESTKRVVSYEEGKTLSMKYNIDFIETNYICNNIIGKLEEMILTIHNKSSELHDNENLLLLNNNRSGAKCCVIL